MSAMKTNKSVKTSIKIIFNNTISIYFTLVSIFLINHSKQAFIYCSLKVLKRQLLMGHVSKMWNTRKFPAHLFCQRNCSEDVYEHWKLNASIFYGTRLLKADVNLYTAASCSFSSCHWVVSRALRNFFPHKLLFIIENNKLSFCIYYHISILLIVLILF